MNYSELWANLKNSYDSGEYQAALELLQQISVKGPAEYYNLGATYFRLNEFGKAAAYFEKAKKLDPQNTDTLYNLNVAMERLRETSGKADFFTQTMGEQIFSWISPDGLLLVTSLIAAVFLFFAFRAWTKDQIRGSIFLQLSSIIGLSFLVFSTAIFLQDAFSEPEVEAACLETQTIRSGPGSQYLELEQLPAGAKVTLGESQELEGVKWVQIGFLDGRKGWVKHSSLLLL